MNTLDGNTLGMAQISVFDLFQLLVTIECVLRVWARKIAGVKLALNDYLIFSALVRGF
jgi:hypothetical protein